MIVPHLGDIYYCSMCNKELKIYDVQKNWKCPFCNNLIDIIIIINKIKYTFKAQKVYELKEGNQVTLDRKFIYPIIVAESNDNFIYLALLGYGSIKKPKESYILVVKDVIK